MQTDSAATASSKDLKREGLDRRAEEGWPVFRYSLWASMILCWLVEALSYRYSLSPDGINYLDIASACMKGQWTAAVNAYWSPGYPVLLSFWLSIFHPSAFRELAAVKYFNCLVLVLALYCFEYFLQGVLKYTLQAAGDDREEGPLPIWALRATGYTLFFWISLYLTPPSLDTPDVLVFASILLAAGILVRVAAGADGWLRFAALGIVLGLGYLAKAIMFPLAFIFLAAAPFAVGNVRRAIPRLLLALILFSAVSAPFLLLISRSKGRFTFGDSGRINYAEYVNGVNLFVHWQGEPPGTGTPKHPTRKILETPPVYEYASPVTGTYPPGSDPSYWYDGVRPHFELKGQLNAFRLGLDDYFELSTRLGSLLAGLVVLLLWGNRLRDFLKRFWSAGFLWIPALAGLAAYALIHVESRFLGGFLILLWAGTFSVVRIPRTEVGTRVLRCVILTIVLLLDVQIAWSMGHSVIRLKSFHVPEDVEVARELIHEGIASGDKIAVVGFVDPYWAYLAKVSIVAEVYQGGVASFWGAGSELRTQVLNLLAKSGAKALVAKDVPPTLLADGWRQVGATSYFFLVLPGP
ncbi:MAG: hypothetical protein LAN18_08545 [Acidobacteriia bacterium]|nr:hypothetical protein [Terriglobia bacterium]